MRERGEKRETSVETSNRTLCIYERYPISVVMEAMNKTLHSLTGVAALTVNLSSTDSILPVSRIFCR